MEGPSSLSSIQMKGRVNHSRCKKYIEWLEDRDLVESLVEKRKAKLRLTPGGHHFALVLLGKKPQLRTK
jgi:predicted transcriptional regulator